MLGQDYFDLRSRLGTALFSLSTLAAEVGAEEDHTVILTNLVNSLKDPFVFVVVGEVNVGKSTLLNALFGAEFSTTGVTPTTDRIVFFKHGPQHLVTPVTPTLNEVQVPADFLKDFHIVDTPGTNSIADEHREITERFVPVADLVIFVFSAMNPWGASAWQFLDKVHRQWMRHVVFVLQQADLRTAEEVEVIVEYMRQLSQQRYGREFPIFAVSGKKAYLAKTGGLDRERLLEQSGFPALEQHISRAMTASTPRTTKLTNALRIAREILGTLREHAGGRVSHQEDKMGLLRQMDAELGALGERTIQKYASVVEASEGDLVRGSAELLETLRNQWSVRQILYGRQGANLGVLEQRLASSVAPPMVDRWERASAILQDDIARCASAVGNVVQEQLKGQLSGDLQPPEPIWAATKQRFGERAAQAVAEVVGQLKLEQELGHAARLSQRWALVQWVALLGALLAATVLRERPWWQWAAVLAAGGVLVGLLGYLSARGLRRALQDAEDKLILARPSLRRVLGGWLRDEVTLAYEALGRALDPLRHRLQEQATRQGQIQEQIEHLGRTFVAIEERIKSLNQP